MNQEEKELFFEVVSASHNEKRVCSKPGIISDCSGMLGAILMNRLGGIVYSNLADSEFFTGVPREFRNTLYAVYNSNLERNKSYYASLIALAKVLEPVRGKYAALKGVLLCGLYPPGCRTSNDVDILVAGRDLDSVGKALSLGGFVQGYIKGGKFKEAGRSEIVASRMLRGETVPYVKKMGLPFMEYLEVDINFSTDYKQDSGGHVDSIIRGAASSPEGPPLAVPDKYDFFIHLCQHLYKEASTLPWIEMGRDMTLYKYCDIQRWLGTAGQDEVSKMYDRIQLRSAAVPCAYALWSCQSLFGTDTDFLRLLYSKLAGGNDEFLHTVSDPAGRRTLIYTQKDLKKRFWHRNRKELLTEL